jgi:hypothetical protein
MKLIKTLLAAGTFLASASSAYAAVTLTNPTPNITSLGSIFQIVFQVLVGIIGGLAIIFIIIGAIRYILARGEPKATESARNTITAAIVGLVVAVLAVAIVTIVSGFLGAGNGIFTGNTINQ